MTNQEALKDLQSRAEKSEALKVAINALSAIENIKTDLKAIRFNDENAQFGFNAAVAIFNKHLGKEQE